MMSLNLLKMRIMVVVVAWAAVAGMADVISVSELLAKPTLTTEQHKMLSIVQDVVTPLSTVVAETPEMPVLSPADDELVDRTNVAAIMAVGLVEPSIIKFFSADNILQLQKVVEQSEFITAQAKFMDALLKKLNESSTPQMELLHVVAEGYTKVEDVCFKHHQQILAHVKPVVDLIQPFISGGFSADTFKAMGIQVPDMEPAQWSQIQAVLQKVLKQIQVALEMAQTPAGLAQASRMAVNELLVEMAMKMSTFLNSPMPEKQMEAMAVMFSKVAEKVPSTEGAVELKKTFDDLSQSFRSKQMLIAADAVAEVSNAFLIIGKILQQNPALVDQMRDQMRVEADVQMQQLQNGFMKQIEAQYPQLKKMLDDPAEMQKQVRNLQSELMKQMDPKAVKAAMANVPEDLKAELNLDELLNDVLLSDTEEQKLSTEEKKVPLLSTEDKPEDQKVSE